ncbi:histidine kinase N-terminal 7TM domain-containing protein [Blautia sp. HCP28S3_G10]|uniref:histidine kinase N-terminal 7TM domain-containing protein n=1 Tax=Blautia sp. HCP28S3_G10 TaxID=3438908 RepID=UPI003F88AF6B
MPYKKKRFFSYTTIFLCVLVAYTCRLIDTDNNLLQSLADQCRTSIYLGMYCAWVIYLNKHIVHKRMRQCLTAIGCLMVFWFFLRTIKYHVFQDPLSEHICWYLYYIPMLLIPTLGLNAALILEEKENGKIKKKHVLLFVFAAVLIIGVFTNDLHQQVFRFYLKPPYSDNSYGYGFLFLIIQIWIIFCLSAMDVILVRRSKTSGKKRFWLPVIPGIVLWGWNIGNILRLPFLSTIAGDLTAICCLCMAAIFQSCILCGLIPTNSRYFELFQSTGSLDAEITDETFRRYYYTGNFPNISKDMRECVIAGASMQENGILVRHIPVKGGHLFWTEDISVLLDQYQDIQEQQEELTERNQLLQMTYQKEAARRKLEEQNRLLNMIQDQTHRQYELLSLYMEKIEQTDSIEECDILLSKIVVVGTYLKRRKNLVLTRYSSQGDSLTMADLKQSLAESCENLKLCKIRAAYFVQDKEKLLHADDVLRCYDFFEWLIEQLFDVVNSIFFRVTQIEEKLQISVHVVCLADIRDLLAERPDLLIQQEEQEWFIRCPVS